MNPAGFVCLLAIGFFAIAFILVAGMSLLGNWLLAVCPHCSQQIRRSNKDLPCPLCGDGQIRDSRFAQANLDQLCCSCAGELKSESAVRLWDGECYCNACVANISPQLLARARVEDQFCERMNYSESEIWNRHLSYGLIVGISFAALLALLQMLSGEPELAVTSFFFFSVLGTLVSFLFASGAKRELNEVGPAFTACDGKLIIRAGSHIYDVPLRECVWFEGKAWQTAIFGKSSVQLAFRGPAIVVQTPETYSERGSQVTVGFTAETYEIWKSFFTLAGVPEKRIEKKHGASIGERLYDWWLSPC